MNILDIKEDYCSLFCYKGQRYGLIQANGYVFIFFDDDGYVFKATYIAYCNVIAYFIHNKEKLDKVKIEDNGLWFEQYNYHVETYNDVNSGVMLGKQGFHYYFIENEGGITFYLENEFIKNGVCLKFEKDGFIREYLDTDLTRIEFEDKLGFRI